jgi:hypothetical protein
MRDAIIGDKSFKSVTDSVPALGIWVRGRPWRDMICTVVVRLDREGAALAVQGVTLSRDRR